MEKKLNKKIWKELVDRSKKIEITLNEVMRSTTSGNKEIENYYTRPESKPFLEIEKEKNL